jgi:hypothetical protein
MKGVLIVFIITISYLALLNAYPHAMISPGELVDGHQSITNKCNSCHEPLWGIPNEKCITCHKLAEIGINNDTNAPVNKVPFHTYLKNEKCTSCHSDHNGVKPALSYNSFKHDLLYETVKSNCISCHNKPPDNLHLQLSTQCVNCHSTAGWKSIIHFDHDLIQSNTKNNCALCHKVPIDNFHGSFKENCSKCHNTDKWTPSSFDHSNYFILDQNHSAQCNICHMEDNFNNYTCYGCHEHSESKLKDEHNEEGIYNINGCLTCHKSGNKHDLKYNDKSGSKSRKDEKKEGHEGNEGDDDD